MYNIIYNKKYVWTINSRASSKAKPQLENPIEETWVNEGKLSLGTSSDIEL